MTEKELLAARQSIVQKLTQARLEKGLSQEQLAKRIGTQRSNICRIEKGTQNLSPAGPTSLQPGVPAVLPDMRTGALIPSLNESVMAISTCVALRSGPSTRTLASWPFGPTMVTCSVQAYCPGWDSMRNTVS